MNALVENMGMIAECADKLAHLGEKLFIETEMKYRAGNKVRVKSLDWYNENRGMNGLVGLFTPDMKKLCGKIVTLDSAYNGKYTAIEAKGYYLDDSMIEGLVEEEIDMGEISDGYHTFNELYEYRMLYNAALFNEFAKQGLYDVHKSRKHSDGEYPFGDSNWFIVMAELPTGQISNHYEMKDWDKFQIPEKPLANKWDEHSPRDVADRLTSFTTPKKVYPKTYEECCEVLSIASFYNLRYHTYEHGFGEFTTLNKLCSLQDKLNILGKLLICRDAYWKIAGEEMGLGKPWEPDWNTSEPKYVIAYTSHGIEKQWETTYCKGLAFPTAEMRDAFYENFRDLIENCKELL